MFRYIGLSWNPSSPSEAVRAERMHQALTIRSAWRCDTILEGHRVYTIDVAPGVNGVYPLPGHRGVVVGRIFRKSDLGPTTSPDVELSTSDAAKIVRTSGRALVDDFWGRYVAFLPTVAGDPRVLRDPTGTLPCFHLAVDGISLVFSRLEDVCSLLSVRLPSLSWDAVAAQMLVGVLGGRRTMLTGLTQVLAGEIAPISGSGGTSEQLWDAADVARRASMATPDQAARSLRETVMRCAQRWRGCYPAVVLRLSGGVDSSILLGSLLPTLQSNSVTCLNYHLAGQDSDERHFARLAAQRAGAPLLERTLDPWFLLEDILRVDRSPTPANYLGGMGAERTDLSVAKAQAASAIFTGAAGDQLFFEFRCTWPATDYLRIRGLDSGFLATALESAHLGRVSIWSALRQAVSDRSFKGSAVEDAGRFSTLMNSEAMASASGHVHEFTHPTLSAAGDLPIGKFHQLQELILPVEYYNHYLGESAPDVVHPLLSQPILELCLATPTYVLAAGGQGRGLARKAFANDIPPEIARRRSKGATGQYVKDVLQRNLPFAREMLMDGQLIKEGLLDAQRVETALSDRPTTNAAFVSEIHACLATEAWLRRVAVG